MARKDLSKDPTNLQAMWRKAKKFYYELKKTGLSDTVVAAILGNIAQESSFDPKARAGSYSGYIQNQKEIVNWIIKHFGGYNHIHQMNYLIAGLTQKLPDKVSQWGKELNTRFNTFLQGLTNNITVAQATKLWENSYEKSGGQSLQQRINYANYFYKQILEENKTTPVRKTPKIKQKNKTIAYQIPETTYPQENSKFQEPQQEYIVQTNNTYDSFPLFFDFKNYQTPETYEPQSVDQTKTEFDLPVYASNFKKGGKLIKRGQQGTILHKTIYLKKDGNESESPHSELKSWIADITPEERMDQTTQQLNERLSTYKPTKELQQASQGIVHPFSWWEAIPALAPVVIPTAIATGPETGATLINPSFWGNLIKDTALYTAADATSEGITGKGIGAHVNNAIGLEEEHPVGEAIGFGGTSFLRKPLEKGITSAYKGLRGTSFIKTPIYKTKNINLIQGYKTVIPRFIKNVKNSDIAAKTERTLGAIPTIINPKKVKIFAKSPELIDNIPIYSLKDFSTKELATLQNQWAKEIAKGPYSPNYNFYLELNKGKNLSQNFQSARDLLSMEKLAERYGKYLSTRYNQILEKITDPVLRHIVEVSPQYMEEVYAQQINVGKATPEFVKDLIKRANSYRRFMNRPLSAEDFSMFKGHSVRENNMGSIDVEGRIVSGNYGPFPAYFEGQPSLTGDYSTWWDQRIPQGVNVRRGMHDSDIAGSKLINKIYNNKNLRHTNTISVMQEFNKNYTAPRGFIDWPVHQQFYGPRGTQLPNFKITVNQAPKDFNFGKGYKLGGKLTFKK